MPEVRELEVVRAGALSTVQDLGRPGYAHLGVPHSGALDLPALRLANRLVGNDEAAAAMETTLDGVAVRVSQAMTLGVAGARCAIRLHRAGVTRTVAWGEPVSVSGGTVVEVGRAEDGLRSYLAVSGGIAVTPVLGSRSTDLLSGLGPAPLRVGDRLPVGSAQWPLPSLDQPVVRSARGGPAVLRLRLGPRADWFDPAAVQALHGSSYDVGSGSNRIGLRLVGPALTRARDGELASEGMVLGAIQVPPDGQPVVFLADHPTTGGYPVVGVVLGDDLAQCAQLRPGEQVTLRVV